MIFLPFPASKYGKMVRRDQVALLRAGSASIVSSWLTLLVPLIGTARLHLEVPTFSFGEKAPVNLAT